jgi:vancomycin resistance protein YoaR
MALVRVAQWFGSKAGRGSLSVGVAVVAGLAAGYLLVPGAPLPTDKPPPVPEVRLLGTPLDLGDGAVEQALARVRRYAAGTLTLKVPDSKDRSVQIGRLGAEIDKVRLTQLVKDARDRTSPLRETWLRRGARGAIELPVPVALNRERAMGQLLLLKDELDRVPSNARLDLERRQLVHEVLGRQLDVDQNLYAIDQALARGESAVDLMFEERRPKRLARDLGQFGFDAVLGYFETHYSRAEKDLARAYNLRNAASKLDGTVLLPGEVFDFNDVVGPRDEANGYKVAPVIAEGELVDGIGGGTCQISGTLHGAAFFAGLEIVERSPHTRPSGYIKMGLDATVVYPTINLRFKNPFDAPVVLHETVKNGVVRAEILGKKRALTVTYIRKIDAAVPYEQVERPDKNLPSGVRVLGQRGVPGFRLHRYRILRDGPHARRERWNDVYPPTTQIVRVGTGDLGRDSVKAQDDPHPEYLADELLTMTQGPASGETDEGTEHAPEMQERREPGHFGDGGWTERAGMPFWNGDSPDQDHDKRSRDRSDKGKQGAPEGSKAKKPKRAGAPLGPTPPSR